MARASKRTWLAQHEEETIAAIRDCRQRTGKLQMNAPIHGPEYRVLARLRKAIDKVALVLTGDRDFFMGAPPRSPSMGLISPSDASDTANKET
jgi:hypothetical protein